MARQTCSSCSGRGTVEVPCPISHNLGDNYGDYTACYYCKGTGRVDERCSTCGGSGYIEGGSEWQSISDDPKYKTQGSSGSSGGSSGDTPDVLVLQGHMYHRKAMAAMREYDAGNDDKWAEYLEYCRQAIPFYTKAINYPGCGKVFKLEALVKRGYCNRATKNTDQAIEDCTNAINIDSDVPEAYMDRALAYIDKNFTENKDKVIADFKQAADLGFEQALQALSQLEVEYTPTPRTPSTQAAPKAQRSTPSSTQSAPPPAPQPKPQAQQQSRPQTQSASTPRQRQSASSSSSGDSKTSIKLWIIGSIVVLALAFGYDFVMDLISEPKPATTATQTAPAAPAATAKAAPKIPTATTLTAINLRATPSAKGKLVKAVAKGQTVSVIGAPKNGWQMVTHGKDKGWVTVGSIKKN